MAGLKNVTRRVCVNHEVAVGIVVETQTCGVDLSWNCNYQVSDMKWRLAAYRYRRKFVNMILSLDVYLLSHTRKGFGDFTAAVFTSSGTEPNKTPVGDCTVAT